MTSDPQSPALLKHTPLYDLHLEAGAKMVPFAGYEMPVQFALGVLGEHNQVREHAGLFDVSHMGQAILSAETGLAGMLERMVPGDIESLKPGRMRYTQFLNGEGGILDDLMATRLPDEGGRERLFLVVNAACKDADFARLRDTLTDARLDILDDRALLALQGPKAAVVLSRHFPGVEEMPFMTLQTFPGDNGDIVISRSGYTGEDGYEISVPEMGAAAMARQLMEADEVEPIGLGARDSLRLEAGLCLYGHDIDETTSPIEAGLIWSISKRRRTDGGFPGADRIKREIERGPARKRVGILPDGRAPAREGTEIMSAQGEVIGTITSGGFGPTHGGPVAMGYVRADHSEVGTKVDLMVRGKARPAHVAAMPFAPHRYYRGK